MMSLQKLRHASPLCNVSVFLLFILLIIMHGCTDVTSMPAGTTAHVPRALCCDDDGGVSRSSSGARSVSGIDLILLND